MKEIVKYILMLILALGLSMCGKNDHAKEGAEKPLYTCPMHPAIIRQSPGKCPICGMDLVLKGDHLNDGAIHLSPNQIELANITTTLIQPANLSIQTILPGRVVVDEENAALISSRVAGRIERLYFNEIGRPVHQGERLYEIYSAPLRAIQEEFLLALRQWEELKDSRYGNFVKAAKKNLMRYGMTESQVAELARRKQAESQIAILAPTSGVISSIDIAVGQYVEEGSPLFRIDNLDQVWVEASLNLNESGGVGVGNEVQVTIGEIDNFVESKIHSMDPAFQNGSQLITVRVAIKNREGKFLPGMSARVILSRERKMALAVPPKALIRVGERSQVWIQSSDGSYRAREVKTGAENFDKIEVLEGLKENERVVITGAYLLYAESVLNKGAVMAPMEGN